MTKIYSTSQNYATVHQLGVAPGQPASSLRISEGKWSLSSLSTVPYVTLTGDGFSKTFSWGELIEVPVGCSTQVINASSHAGDIYLNAGWDFCSRPARITVPVPLMSFDSATGELSPFPSPPAAPDFPLSISPQYPVDTRLARRAYFVINYNPPVNEVNFIVVGQPKTASMNTYNLAKVFAASPLPKVGYLNVFNLLPLTNGAYVPLGYIANITESTVPHVLLDFAIVLWTIMDFEDYDTNFLPAAFYVVEY